MGYSPWGHKIAKHDLVTKQQHLPLSGTQTQGPLISEPLQNVCLYFLHRYAAHNTLPNMSPDLSFLANVSLHGTGNYLPVTSTQRAHLTLEIP